MYIFSFYNVANTCSRTYRLLNLTLEFEKLGLNARPVFFSFNRERCIQQQHYFLIRHNSQNIYFMFVVFFEYVMLLTLFSPKPCMDLRTTVLFMALKITRKPSFFPKTYLRSHIRVYSTLPQVFVSP